MVTRFRGVALERRCALPARKRFAAACAASALVHVMFAQGITPGAPGRSGEVRASPVIAARLAVPSAPARDEPPLERAPPVEPLQPQPPVARARGPFAGAPQTAKIEPDPGSSPRSSTGMANAPDATYYAARELDVYPALASTLDLRALPAPAAADLRARAALLVLIDAHGAVDEVKIVEAGPGSDFEAQARQALLAARFTPALKNGRAVRSRLLIRIDHGGESAAP